MSLAKEMVDSQRKNRFFLALFLAVLVVGTCLLYVWRAGHPAPGIVAANSVFNMKSVRAVDYSFVGKRCYISDDGATNSNRGNPVLSFKSRSSFADWHKSYLAKDHIGIEQLSKTDQAVQVEPQTQCIILEIHYFSWGVGMEFEVRVIEGPHKGIVLFLHKNFLCTNSQGTNR